MVFSFCFDVVTISKLMLIAECLFQLFICLFEVSRCKSISEQMSRNSSAQKTRRFFSKNASFLCTFISFFPIIRTRINLGDRSFSAAGPRVWNYLPTALRQPALSHSRFGQSLKTFLFAQWDESAVRIPF